MAVPLDEQGDVRRMDRDGVPRARIAREPRLSRNAVAKCADSQDMSPEPPIGQKRAHRATDEIAQWIDAILTDDLCAPKKQRHTASRILDRAVEEKGYAGSHSSIRRHVATWKKEHVRGPGDGFPGLAWAPGAAQADFGDFTAQIAGKPVAAKLLVVSFPCSNALSHGPAMREGGGLLPGPAHDLRADRAPAAPARARQRHRGGADAVRQGHGVRTLLAVPGPPPLRGPPPRPVLRQREGVGGERRRVPEAQPPRARARGVAAGRAQWHAQGRLRQDERAGAEQGWEACRGGVPGGPRGHAGAAGSRLRRGRVGQREGGQARIRARGRESVLRRADVARPRAGSLWACVPAPWGRSPAAEGMSPRSPAASGRASASGTPSPPSPRPSPGRAPSGSRP